MNSSGCGICSAASQKYSAVSRNGPLLHSPGVGSSRAHTPSLSWISPSAVMCQARTWPSQKAEAPRGKK